MYLDQKNKRDPDLFLDSLFSIILQINNNHLCITNILESIIKDLHMISISFNFRKFDILGYNSSTNFQMGTYLKHTVHMMLNSNIWCNLIDTICNIGRPKINLLHKNQYRNLVKYMKNYFNKLSIMINYRYHITSHIFLYM